MNKKTSLLFILVVLIISINGLSIQESIDLAKKNNKQLKVDSEEVEKAEYTYREVRSSLLPQVYFNSGIQMKNTTLPKSAIPASIDFDEMLSTSASADDHEIMKGMNLLYTGMIPNKDKEETSINGQIKVDQVLFLGGKLINGIRVAAKYRNLQKQKYQISENKIEFDVIDTYQQALLLQEVLKINQEALALAKEHYKRVSKLHDEGLISDYDKLRAELEVSRLEPQLTESQNNLDLVIANLKRMTGIPVSDDVELTSELVTHIIPELNLEQSINIGKENRIELKIAGLYQEMIQVKYNAESSNYLPNISFSADMTKFTASKDYSVNKNDFGTLYEAGIFMQIPLFTGLGNTSKRLNARHDLRQAEYQKLDAIDLIQLEITQNWLSMKHAEENMTVYQKNVQLAQKGYQIAKSRYENQIGIQLEVLDAQTLLNSSKVSYINGIYQLNKAINLYKKSLGEKLIY